MHVADAGVGNRLLRHSHGPGRGPFGGTIGMFAPSPTPILRVVVGSSVVGTSPIGAIRLYAERLLPDAELERTT